MTGFTHCFDVSVVDFEQVNTVLVVSIYLASQYLVVKFCSRYSRKRYEIYYSKLTIKAPERRFLLMTLKIFHIFFYCFYR